MVSPLVTAICCAYNYARWLPRALDSALAQGAGPEELEIVVIDDGSTDETPQVVTPYLASPLVRYVRKENGGFASAVSRGIDEARGRYLTFLDADDTWPRDRLRAQIEHLQSHPETALVYSDMEVIDEEDRVIAPSFMALAKLRPASGDLLAKLHLSNVVSGGSLMVRAELVHLFNPIPPQIRCQDWWIAIRAASVGEIRWVPGVVYRYRQHGSNMNLGRADRRANGRDAVEFRRLTLAAPEADRVPLSVVLGSLQTMLREHDHVRDLVPVDDVDRLRADEHGRAALEAAAASDYEGAIRALVRAQAADPDRDQAALFDRLQRQLILRQDGLRIETRARRVLAFSDELVADPTLLDAFARSAGDETTLVVQVTAPDDVAPLAAAVDALDAEIDAVAVQDHPDRLAACCDALLSRRTHEGALALLRVAA